MKDFYYILGIDSNCTSNETREAYRKLSKKFHPDVNPDDDYFESRFREIKEAYETLIDPDKKRVYDRELNKFRKQNYYSEQAENLRNQEDELRRREEELKFSRTFRHRASNTSDQQKYPYPFKRKGMGLGVTITLVLIALIFGIYIFKSLSGSKRASINRTSSFSSAAAPIRKRHKRKHSIINKIPVDTVSHVNLIAATKHNPAPDSIKNDTKSYLYATNVMPNVTGVVNMRKLDNFNSEIIKVIPANSKVMVLEKGDVYYKVSFSNSIGYVPKWFLQIK